MLGLERCEREAPMEWLLVIFAVALLILPIKLVGWLLGIGMARPDLRRRGVGPRGPLAEASGVAPGSGDTPDVEIRRRAQEAALESKAKIEAAIARHGVAGPGLSLDDIRRAEEELKRAGVEDWRIRLR